MNPLNLKPATENSTVLTVFLADNFNAKIDNDNKMINFTHIVAFQESTSGAVERQDRILLQKSRKRSIEPIFQEEQNIIANPKKEPPLIDVVVAAEGEEICQSFNDWLDIYVKMIRTIQNFLDGLSYLCKQLHQQQ